MNHETIAARLPEIIGIARLAPSVHNTQPWLVSCKDATIQVKLDESHLLREGDPTGRQTIISLGIFCEAIKIAAESLGFLVKEVTLSGSEAALLVGGTAKPPEEARRYAALLRLRHSDRSIYRPADITKTGADSIEKAAGGNGIGATVSFDRSLISKVAELTSKGIGLAMSNPDFRNELSRYLILPWSRKKRGIAVKSLYVPPFLAYIQPWLVKSGMGVKQEAKLERKRWESASAIVLIAADGDLAQHWFEAGRAYMRASLEISGLGLAQATSAAIVEASNYHDDIEKMLGTNQRVLAIMRIGKGSPKHNYSPRVAATELITSN